MKPASAWSIACVIHATTMNSEIASACCTSGDRPSGRNQKTSAAAAAAAVFARLAGATLLSTGSSVAVTTRRWYPGTGTARTKGTVPLIAECAETRCQKQTWRNGENGAPRSDALACEAGQPRGRKRRRTRIVVRSVVTRVRRRFRPLAPLRGARRTDRRFPSRFGAARLAVGVPVSFVFSCFRDVPDDCDRDPEQPSGKKLRKLRFSVPLCETVVSVAPVSVQSSPHADGTHTAIRTRVRDDRQAHQETDFRRRAAPRREAAGRARHGAALSHERRGDYGPFDLNFHRVVAECARNLPLKVLMDSLSDLTVEVVAGLDLSAGVQHAVCDSHRQIADAIKQRDEEAAYTLMLEHVAQIQDRLGRALARQRRRVKKSGGGNGRPARSRRSPR